MAARSQIEDRARLCKLPRDFFCDVLYRETTEIPTADSGFEAAHRAIFQKVYQAASPRPRQSRAARIDLDKLGSAMDIKRDDLFTYLGIQTLYDRYFIHHENGASRSPKFSGCASPWASLSMKARRKTKKPSNSTTSSPNLI